MSERSIDLTGHKFGRLTVLWQFKGRYHHHDTLWDCKCECGVVTTKRASSLKRGMAKSCGCLAKEITSQRARKYKNEVPPESNINHLWVDAWAAGILDGEGCVYVKRSMVYKKYLHYGLCVQVAQSGIECPSMLLLLRKTYGGTIGKRSICGVNCKPKWAWYACADTAQVFLERVEKYVVQKHEQVQLALKFQIGRAHV